MNEEAPSSAAHAPPVHTDWKAVIAATFAGVAASLQIGKAAGALPLMRHEFGADLATMSAYAGLLSIVAAVAGLSFGNFSRRFDPRAFGRSGLAIIAAGSVLTAFAQGVPFLMTGRLIEAIGFSMVATTMPAIIQRASARRHRALTLGIWATWLPTGVAGGLALSWLMIDWGGWRAVYYACAAILAIAAQGLISFAPRAPADGTGGAAAVGIGSVLHRDPLTVTLIFVSFAAANMIVMSLLPTFLVDELAMTASEASAVSMFAALVLLPANIGAGWLLDRGVSARMLLTVSLLVITGSALIFLAPATGAVTKLVAIFVFAFATGVPPSILWASIPVLAQSPREAPLISGLLYQGAGLGQLGGPVLAGWAVTLIGGWLAAGWTIAAIVAVGLVGVAALRVKLDHGT